MENSILYLVHRVYKDGIVKRGGSDYIIDYLKMKGFNILTIEHPLNSKGVSYIKNGSNVPEVFNLIGTGPVRWIHEVIFNISKALSKKVEYKLILAVDPLNFLSAYLIKLFKNSHTKILFHSIDYSENRFGSFILDTIYNYIYAFAVRKADIVTHVSTIMGEKIRELSDFKLRTLYYLPNSPEYSKIPKVDVKVKNKYALVYSKSFLSRTEIDLLIKVTQNVKKQYPEINLNIIGNLESESISKINRSSAKENIKLHGLIPYEKNINLISESYIGLAWYENKISFEKYNDSLKLREYAASGLPAICNDGTSTAYEMQNAGAGIMVTDESSMVNSIKELISNQEKYNTMRQKALEWAKAKDKVKLLDQLFEKIKL